MKKPSKTLSQSTKRLFLVWIPPPVWGVWMNFKSGRSLTKKVYDQKLMEDTVREPAWERLQKNILMDGNTMIDKRTGGALGPEVDCTYWKDKF